MEEIKKQKIKVTCPTCNKTFTTNIGWAFQCGGKMVCKKCSTEASKNLLTLTSLDEAVAKLKETGLVFDVI